MSDITTILTRISRIHTEEDYPPSCSGCNVSASWGQWATMFEREIEFEDIEHKNDCPWIELDRYLAAVTDIVAAAAEMECPTSLDGVCAYCNAGGHGLGQIDDLASHGADCEWRRLQEALAPFKASTEVPS